MCIKMRNERDHIRKGCSTLKGSRWKSVRVNTLSIWFLSIKLKRFLNFLSNFFAHPFVLVWASELVEIDSVNLRRGAWKEFHGLRRAVSLRRQQKGKAQSKSVLSSTWNVRNMFNRSINVHQKAFLWTLFTPTRFSGFHMFLFPGERVLIRGWRWH